MIIESWFVLWYINDVEHPPTKGRCAWWWLGSTDMHMSWQHPPTSLCTLTGHLLKHPWGIKSEVVPRPGSRDHKKFVIMELYADTLMPHRFLGQKKGVNICYESYYPMNYNVTLLVHGSFLGCQIISCFFLFLVQWWICPWDMIVRESDHGMLMTCWIHGWFMTGW